MSSSGQFHIDRGIFFDSLADDRPWCSIAMWIYLISRAQFKPTSLTFRGHHFDLERGQLTTTLNQLCDVAGWTKKRLRIFLAKCVKDGKITTQGLPRAVIISIVNYDKWQAPVFVDESRGTVKGTVEVSPEATELPFRGTVKGTQSIYIEKYLQKKKIPPIAPQIDEVLAYLNQQTGKSIRNPGPIGARLKEGYTVEQLKSVINKKVKEWTEPKMRVFLRPSTLFCPKHFDEYLNQEIHTTSSRGVTDPHAWDDIKGW